MVATVGAKGRVVLPAALRSERAWDEGTKLLFIPSANGVTIMTREEGLAALRSAFQGRSVTDELISERRAAAALERETA